MERKRDKENEREKEKRLKIMVTTELKNSLNNFSLAPRSFKFELLGSFMILIKPQLLGERWAAVRCVVLITNNQHLQGRWMKEQHLAEEVWERRMDWNNTVKVH